MTAAARLLAEGESAGRDLPLPPWGVGLSAFLILCFLLALTATFGKDR
jgi:hypothetical protein